MQPEGGSPRTRIRRAEDREIRTLLSSKMSYFISSEKLGLIEAAVHRMNTSPRKRGRAVELNDIQFVLKRLNAIPQDAKVVALGYGCLDTGDAGLLIVCESPIKILGKLPEVI